MTLSWFVALASSGLAFAVELYEGHPLSLRMFSEVDVLIHVVLIPALLWLLLTLVAASRRQQRASQRHLQWHIRFTQQLAEPQAWDELVSFITCFPATLIPIGDSALFIKNHRLGRFDLAGTEGADPRALATDATERFTACAGCPLASWPLRSILYSCPHPPPPLAPETRTHCLVISHDRLIVGLLRFTTQAAWTPSEGERHLLETAAGEVAVALAMAIAHTGQLSQAQVEARRDERRFVAHSLHDSLAQHLGYLHLNLDRLVEGPALPPSALREELEHLRQVADDAYKRVRSTLAFVRSQESGDLPEAIESLVNSFRRDRRLTIALKIVGRRQLVKAEVGQQCVNLVREALNNVHKHAHPKQAQVTIEYLADGVQLTVTDEGPGFDPTQPRPGEHYGLAMLAEQLNAGGGQLVVSSAPGQPTRIGMYVPLRRVPTAVPKMTEFNHL